MPVVASWSPNATARMLETEELEISVDAFDPDGDLLTYGWEMDGQPILGWHNYYYVFRPDRNESHHGGHSFGLNISDGTNIMYISWQIIVEDVDRYPQLGEILPADGARFSLTETVTFDARDSWDDDPDDILTYRWDFGDGGRSIEPLAEHRYDTIGTYTVSLMVLSNHYDYSALSVERIFNITIEAAEVKITDIKLDKQELKTGETVKLMVTVQNSGTMECEFAVITIKMAGEVLGTTRVEGVGPGKSKEVLLFYKMEKKGTYRMTAAITEADEDTLYSDYEVQSGSFKVVAADPGKPSRPGTTIGGRNAYLLPIIAALVIIGPAYIVLRNLRDEERWLEERERLQRKRGSGPKDR
jgi:hypothetical protein